MSIVSSLAVLLLMGSLFINRLIDSPFLSYLLLAAVLVLDTKLDRKESLVVGLDGALLQGGLSLVLGLFLGDFLVGESDSFLLGELLRVAGLEVSELSETSLDFLRVVDIVIL